LAKADREGAGVTGTIPPEGIVIGEWWKNRKHDSIRVRLSVYEGCPLIDIRTWFDKDGYPRPGKGFAASIKHLPRLTAELTKALAKARELGLIKDGAHKS
jgi:hypothetical protein